ncbi:glycoside hydrolase family 75 protein [Caballeronia insecticola]|nr:glycoside hydrolase family 75 protein [Caballeronia insecticola]
MSKIVSILAASLMASLVHAEECADIAQRVAQLDFSKAADVRANDHATFTDLYKECDTHNTFGGKALPTFKGRPLKCSTDPNRVASVVQFADKTVAFKAKAAVDADGSPAACGPQKSATDQCQTWFTYGAGSTRHFIDAEQVPFVVVPLDAPSGSISFMKSTGIGKGDLAVVIRGNQCAFGVVGDAGPYFRLGEASVAAHAELGNPQCAGSERPCTRLRGGGGGVGIGSNVTYIVFPHSRPASLTAENIVQVTTAGAKERLEQFLGGNGAASQ